MNHQKIYEVIINKAKLENRKKYNGIYYENHHIIPKCVGGNDDKDNLVLLTNKEHYVCHKLLTYIYPNKLGIIYAFKLMSSLKFRRIKSPKDYEYAKELYRNLPASEKTKERRLEVWYEIHCNPETVFNYIESMNNAKFNPNNNSSIIIRNDNFKANNRKLKDEIFYYNTQGCTIPIKK